MTATAAQQVGERLRILRQRRGWTANLVANALNTWPTRIYEWEGGRHMPSPETLKKLATIYSVSVDHLLGKRVARKQ